MLSEDFSDLKDMGLRNFVILMTLIAMLEDLKILTSDEIAINADSIYKSQVRPQILETLENEQRKMD